MNGHTESQKTGRKEAGRRGIMETKSISYCVSGSRLNDLNLGKRRADTLEMEGTEASTTYGWPAKPHSSSPGNWLTGCSRHVGKTGPSPRLMFINNIKWLQWYPDLMINPTPIPWETTSHKPPTSLPFFMAQLDSPFSTTTKIIAIIITATPVSLLSQVLILYILTYVISWDMYSPHLTDKETEVKGG